MSTYQRFTESTGDIITYLEKFASNLYESDEELLEVLVFVIRIMYRSENVSFLDEDINGKPLKSEEAWIQILRDQWEKGDFFDKRNCIYFEIKKPREFDPEKFDKGIFIFTD
ncbi:hypothetical protein [Nonlabens sp.]|uniref:hypothetical protein n=1 Tax=Nonlabens sp. TaxID=1888209 RepID=UPI001BCA737C|nr:hypothetical protein [Nonlabens sp.]